MSKKEVKDRYFDKVYDNAKLIDCACGCGQQIKDKDHYGRDKKFINGHNGRKYDDPTQFKREWNHRNRQARYNYKKGLLRERKVRLIISKDSQCQDCKLEYDGSNAAVFDMHHRDESIKEFNVGTNSFNQYSVEKVLEEAEKCDLLCANCHRLRHYKGW